MSGVSYLGHCRNAVHSIAERGFRDIVRLCSLPARQIFGRTNSFDGKDDSPFSGMYRHGVVVELSRVVVGRSRRGRKVRGPMICADRW